MTGVILNGASPAGTHTNAAVEVLSSSDINIANCQILDPTPRGVYLEDSTRCRVSGCTIVDRREPKAMVEACRVEGGENCVIEGNLTT